MSNDNHEMTELELYRKDIVNKDGIIDALKRDIAEMQAQVQHGYIRIKELIEERDLLKSQLQIKDVEIANTDSEVIRQQQDPRHNQSAFKGSS